MIPGRPELLRRRRCRLLLFGMVLGALLPIYQPSWVTLGIALVGVGLLVLVYRRECRDGAVTDPARSDTDTRAPGA